MSEAKQILGRWYDEMWSQKNADLIPELAGPVYLRHEMGGTRTVTASEYRDQTKALMEQVEIADMRYALVGEGDVVVAIGSWSFNGKHWDWVQAFRVEGGKLVETWLSGIGMESDWDDAVWAKLDAVSLP